MMRLRDVASVDPSTSGFSRADAGKEMTFLPLDRIWHDARFDPSLTIEFDGDTKSYTAVLEGDVMVPKVAPTFAHGRVALARDLIGNRALATSEVFVVRTDDRTGARFLQYRLQAADVVSEGIASWTGVAGLKRISSDFLRNVRISEGAWDARSVIADFLDAETARTHAMISARTRQRALLEERWSASVRRTVTPNTAEKWTAFKLGREIETGSGTTPSTEIPEFYGDDIPWLNTGDLTDGVVLAVRRGVTYRAVDKHTSLVIYPAGAVVMAMYGATIGKLGMTPIAMAVNQACCVLHSPRRLDPWFVFYWLWSFRDDIIALASGGGQPNINQEIVRGLRIAAPTLTEQRAIAARLRNRRDSLDVAAAAIDRQIALLRERRQALITAAVSGHVDVGG
jgi:type I restriction enzyme S subunit